METLTIIAAVVKLITSAPELLDDLEKLWEHIHDLMKGEGDIDSLKAEYAKLGAENKQLEDEFNG